MRKMHVNTISLVEGSALKSILYFSIPLCIGNVFQQLYNVIDSMIVGNYVGAEALAAVGVCFPVIYTMFALFFGIGNGASVVVAGFCGAGSREGMERTIRTAYIFILAGSIPLAVIGWIWGEDILRWVRVPENILKDASDYLRIYFLASFVNLGFVVNDGLLRGLGDSRSSLKFLMVACIINVVLDLVFVIGFGWSVCGVAVATVIAQTFSFLGSMSYIRRHYMGMEEKMQLLLPDMEILRKICRIGIPTGLQQAIFSLGVVVMQGMINGFGSIFIAGFNAASKIDMFAFMPIQSFASAVTVFVGQNIGAGKKDRIRLGITSALKLSFLVDTAVISLILCFTPYFLKIFNQNPQVLEAGAAYLYRIMPFYFVYTVTSVGHSALRGMGDTMYPTLIMIAALWLGRVPSAYLFSHFGGKENIFFCYGAGWIIEIVLLGIYYRSGRWKKSLESI